MDDQEEDNCTATNLSTDDNAELRDIVSKLVVTAGGDALTLFPRFQKLVRRQTLIFCSTTFPFLLLHALI